MKIDLLSVASVVDDETKMIYARYQNGTHDESSAKPLQQMSNEWYELLSDEDRMIVKELLYQIKKIK
jgi:hypothetical protein